MKKALFILCSVFVFGACSNPADFQTVKITMQVNDEPVVEKIFTGNFMKSQPDELGLIEITDSKNRIKTSYYEESNPNELKFLNVKFGEAKPGEWRKNKGHLLLKVSKNDSLGFFFQDKNSQAGNVTGTILYTK